MEHAQQQILDSIKEMLIAANTAAVSRVFLDRLDQLEPGELPTLLVEEAPEGESIEPQTMSGIEQRVFSVLVTCVVAHSTEYGRKARQLGLEVEKTLGIPALSLPRAGRARIASARMTFSGEGDRALAAREQTWRITYSTRRGAPDNAL